MEWLKIEVTDEELSEFPEEFNALTLEVEPRDFTTSVDKTITVREQYTESSQLPPIPVHRYTESTLHRSESTLDKLTPKPYSNRQRNRHNPTTIPLRYNKNRRCYKPQKRRLTSGDAVLHSTYKNRCPIHRIPLNSDQNRRSTLNVALPPRTPINTDLVSSPNTGVDHIRSRSLRKSTARPLTTENIALLSLKTHATPDILKNITIIRKRLGLL
jgi:hypothetical protein